MIVIPTFLLYHKSRIALSHLCDLTVSTGRMFWEQFSLSPFLSREQTSESSLCALANVFGQKRATDCCFEKSEVYLLFSNFEFIEISSFLHYRKYYPKSSLSSFNPNFKTSKSLDHSISNWSHKSIFPS